MNLFKTIIATVVLTAMSASSMASDFVLFGDGTVDNINWQTTMINYGFSGAQPTENNGSVIADVLEDEGLTVDNYGYIGSWSSQLGAQVSAYIADGVDTSATHVISIGTEEAMNRVSGYYAKYGSWSELTTLANNIEDAVEALEAEGLTDIEVVIPPNLTTSPAVLTLWSNPYAPYPQYIAEKGARIVDAGIKRRLDNRGISYKQLPAGPWFNSTVLDEAAYEAFTPSLIGQ